MAAAGGAGASSVHDYKSLLFSPTKDLWDAYATSIGTTFMKPVDESVVPANFGYMSEKKPMLSQKGATCSTDTFFTLLFESEHLRPLFYGLESTSEPAADDDCCLMLPRTPLTTVLLKGYNNNVEEENIENTRLTAKKGPIRSQYAAVLSAAKARYDRMSVPAENKTRNRRSFSISNALWEQSNFSKIRPCPSSEKPEPHGDPVTSALFFDFLLTSNGLRLPSLMAKNPFRVHLFRHGSVVPMEFDYGSVICMALLIHPITDEWKYKKEKSGHWIGFYKNGDKWYLVNNEIGYIHEIMDTDWVNSIFIPRLVNSSVSQLSIQENIEKKVFVLNDSKLYKGFDMRDLFIPFGERLYPNINPMYANEIPKSVYYPRSLILITQNEKITEKPPIGKGKSLLGSLLSKKTRRVRKRRGVTRRFR